MKVSKLIKVNSQLKLKTLVGWIHFIDLYRLEC